MALVAPELVILWAIRQWMMARKLAKKHQGAFVSSFIPKTVYRFGIVSVRMDNVPWLLCSDGRVHVV